MSKVNLIPSQADQFRYPQAVTMGDEDQSRVGDVASAVENVLAAYSVTTVAPHEYFDQTPNEAADGAESRTMKVSPGAAGLQRTVQ